MSYNKEIGEHLRDIKEEMITDKFAESMLTKKIKGLSKMVRQLMEEDEKCRNSDLYLVWKVWERQGLIYMGKRTQYIGREDFYRAQNPAGIMRIRRSIQSADKMGGAELIPTIWEVAKARGIAKEEWAIQMNRGKEGYLI